MAGANGAGGHVLDGKQARCAVGHNVRTLEEEVGHGAAVPGQYSAVQWGRPVQQAMQELPCHASQAVLLPVMQLPVLALVRALVAETRGKLPAVDGIDRFSSS